MKSRFYVKRKENFDFEAQHLTKELKEILNLPHLQKIQIINQYSIEGVVAKALQKIKEIIFSEPQVDEVFEVIDYQDCDDFFALQVLQGQFDPRSDSALQCIQMLLEDEEFDKETLFVEHVKIYKLYGNIAPHEKEKILSYLINPLEMQEVSMHHPSIRNNQKEGDERECEIDEDFLELQDFENFICKWGLTLDSSDLALIQEYFKKEKRVPNLLELKILETYWSDHCRHTTFFTQIHKVTFEDALAKGIYEQYLDLREELQRQKPITLMDLSTIMGAFLKSQGKARTWVCGDENNACTLSVNVKTQTGYKPYFLFFKNETHNHPTEIEPFGGASTCIGGAIRDPLSARGYVYAGMRISGSANPLSSIEETIKGKLPQRKIALSSSDGYSSYGNQIGVATGMVEEFYHCGYKAKHLELGAVLGSVAQENVISKAPKEGDLIMLVGGETGRDGCGGARGSSRSHHIDSLRLCGAEVQKGNAPQERKLQRFLANKEVTLLIKRCNDLGAGGVSVAIPELAQGVEIFLDKMPCKYEGLSPLELALSESQERMAILIAPENLEKFQALAESENLKSSLVAHVGREQALIMKYFDRVVARIPVELLQSNGALKYAQAHISRPSPMPKTSYSFIKNYQELAKDLNVCSKRGLIEKFDSTIGGNTIFMPLGGKYQMTPIQAMAHKIPFEDTTTCSVASYGFNPFLCEQDPCRGGYFAVIESVCKLIACGVKFEEIYLSFQEYFESLQGDPNKWGKPLGALLGAFLAQKRLGICAIGGKDSMSGSFEELNVPPTFISFAFCASDCASLISPEFKQANHFVYWIKPKLDFEGLPYELEKNFEEMWRLIQSKKIISAYTPTYGGVAEAIMKMCFGNKIGFEFESDICLDELFGLAYGSFVVEATQELDIGVKIGKTLDEEKIILGEDSLLLLELLELYEQPLESLYKTQAPPSISCEIQTPIFKDRTFLFSYLKHQKPRVLIPVFFGTNCEYDTQRAFQNEGAEVELLVIKNLTKSHIEQSIEQMRSSLKRAQILFLAGGFSGGDEPDGSAKMIKVFFNNPILREGIETFLSTQDGLIGGICNGFQALIKLGILPFGSIESSLPTHPTLLHNSIFRHQSKIVQIKVCSNASPWLSQTSIGEVYSVPISHGEGRFYANKETIDMLNQNGQIATQYVDFQGNVANCIDFNPNGSVCGIEGILSKDGRVFGKMGHTERAGEHLYKNVAGNFEMKIFKGAVSYFK